MVGTKPIQQEVELEWKETITPRNRLFHINFPELWEYRDLLIMFVKRDITSIYKQTLLGPLWFFVQPVLTTIVYVLIFSKGGKLPTSGINPILFYLSGLVLWTYFSECVIRTAGFMKENSSILSKVYFPRLILPIAICLTNLVKLGIHLCLFLIFYCYFLFKGEVMPGINILFFPFAILLTGLLGLGLGIMVSSLTTKFKDLTHLIVFLVQLSMFSSTVIFPLSGIQNNGIRKLVMANPMSGVIDLFRSGFFDPGMLNIPLVAYSSVFAIGALVSGILLFNQVERQFVDTL